MGVKFDFELLDNFIGQFAVTFFPHCYETAFMIPLDRGAFLGTEWARLEYTKHFVGVLSYLQRLRWSIRTDRVRGEAEWMAQNSFPVGFPEKPDAVTQESYVFESATAACNYLRNCMVLDLSYRYSVARIDTFKWHIHAKWQLLRSLCRKTDAETQAVMNSWS